MPAGIAGMLAAAAAVTSPIPAVADTVPGSLDPSFGVEGKVVTDFGATEFGYDLALQGDGKSIVVGQRSGSTEPDANPDFAVARHNPDGSLDAEFGSGGKVTTDFGDHEAAGAVVVQGDGKIVVAGGTNIPGRGDAFALARYNHDGSLDPTFGTAGKTTTTAASGVRALSVQTDGKLVAAGNGVVVRYNPDGSLDASFGTNGKVVLGGGYGPLALGDGGRLYLLGPTTGDDFAVVRLNADGSLDDTFGTGGTAVVDLDRGGSSNAITIQTDGQILVGGFANINSFNYDFVLARLQADGSPDTTFGTAGKVTTDFGGGSGGDGITDLRVQGDGKIVAAGFAATLQTGSSTFALARYNPDGSLDPGFGTGGTLTTRFQSLNFANALVIQTDGRILAAGTTTTNNSFTGADFALARYFATTTDDAEDTAQPVCIKVKTDWRAPYNDGTCPSGFELHQVSTTTAGDGLAVCTKTKLDWRAPDKHDLCPGGFNRHNVATAGVPGLPVCVKTDLDWRAPYADGACPSGFTRYQVIEVS